MDEMANPMPPVKEIIHKENCVLYPPPPSRLKMIILSKNLCLLKLSEKSKSLCMTKNKNE